jgi:hypothetical protein
MSAARTINQISQQGPMLGAASFISVVLGAAAAVTAERFPAYVEAIETGAGVLLIGGIALAGLLLPVVA